MKDIHARVPIDRVAARVTRSGVHFNPNKKVETNDSEFPLAIRPLPIINTNLPNLTGTSFGRFRVIGFARDYKKSWVVRCQCGRYSTRSTRAITNPENGNDRCDHCRHLMFLQREQLQK